ncbi:MAG: aldo/keto reductase [Mycetocola sp.]
MTSPTITLNSGATIPQLGFGVYQVPDNEAEQVVLTALETGYRSIDTAALYGNERGVGRAIAASGIPRDELYITTKLWNSDQGAQLAPAAFERSLELLGLDSVDLYLIHWPTPERGLFLETWEVLEGVLASGRARSIGVSNFLPEHLDAVVALGGTVPAVNQIELHPALQQRSVVSANTRHGVATEAWSPLGQGQALSNPIITEIAERNGISPAQAILAWHLASGHIVIPKSVTPARIAENLASTQVTLSGDDLELIDTLESGGRVGPDPATMNRF